MWTKGHFSKTFMNTSIIQNRVIIRSPFTWISDHFFKEGGILFPHAEFSYCPTVPIPWHERALAYRGKLDTWNVFIKSCWEFLHKFYSFFSSNVILSSKKIIFTIWKPVPRRCFLSVISWILPASRRKWGTCRTCSSKVLGFLSCTVFENI